MSNNQKSSDNKSKPGKTWTKPSQKLTFRIKEQFKPQKKN